MGFPHGKILVLVVHSGNTLSLGRAFE